MIVTLLDTETLQTKETGDDFDAYWWAEGNGSCDCNRSLQMGVIVDRDDEFICRGAKRFLITAASDNQYSLREYNDDYPLELLAKFGVV